MKANGAVPILISISFFVLSSVADADSTFSKVARIFFPHPMEVALSQDMANPEQQEEIQKYVW